MALSIKKKYEQCVNYCNTGDHEAALKGFEEIFAIDADLLPEKGLRRTYVLSSWIILGKYSYPPALDSLLRVLKKREEIMNNDINDISAKADVDAIRFCLKNLNVEI